MYRHILLPTDGSKLAERGVTSGLALAKSLGAKETVIVVEEPFSWLGISKTKGQQSLAEHGAFTELGKHVEQIKKYAASVLDDVANSAKQAGVSCDTIQVENTHPYQAIIDAAQDRGCDLIVMSSHGRSGLSGILMGSVTNKVLANAKWPVLVCQ
jgi:nucleotide-binding universal stress UspA family protein